MTIRLTSWGHACVRLERDGHVLVLDPGSYSDLDHALDGAQAVLITHEHADHVDPARVATAGLPVWGPAPVVTLLADAGVPSGRLHEVRAGDVLSAAGFEVHVLGERHAVIHPDVPVIANVGYLVDGILHPGDAFLTTDGSPVDVLLEPIGAPWLKGSEMVDHVRAVHPSRVVPIHDALLSDLGKRSAAGLIERLGGAGAPLVLATGESLDV